MKLRFNHDGVEWGVADLIQSDSEVFGFPVGLLQVSGRISDPKAFTAFRQWVSDTGCVLTSVSLPALDLLHLQVMNIAGFKTIDLSLEVSLRNLKRRPRHLRPGSIRRADKEDFLGIKSIAATAFDFGRYHRDIRFPRPLADRRFALWVSNSLQTPKEGQRFYVLGRPGTPTAFMFVEIHDGRARWHLGGVSRDASNGLLGPLLFASVLNELESEGILSVKGKISAVNTPVLNIYNALGFHAGKPEFTMHYHHHSSDHLLPLD